MKKKLAMALCFIFILGLFTGSGIKVKAEAEESESAIDEEDLINNREMVYKDYIYKISDDHIVISGYIDKGKEVIDDIPEEIDGYPVTEIGRYAFEKCTEETVIIPSTITKIDRGAFSKNDNLKDIYLPNSITDIGL